MTGATRRLMNRHLSRSEVDELRNRCRKAHLSDREVANKLGLSRPYVNRLFNHVDPMRAVYKAVLEAEL